MSLPIARSPLVFRSGVAIGPGQGKVIAQVGLELDPDDPRSQIWEYSKPSGWSHYEVRLTAIRLAGPGSPTWILGEGGYVQMVQDGRITEEMVDPTENGPM